MADVSVRFTVAGDSEIVLNLAVPQAVRLIEALVHKVGEAVAATGGGQGNANWQDVSRPPLSAPPYRPSSG
jgi:hypothetical protein